MSQGSCDKWVTILGEAKYSSCVVVGAFFF